MKITKILCAMTATLGLMPAINAMTLNARGIGQVLLYPYYTVNNHQQTLLSIVNTTGSAKALRVRFREGYNGRSVLAFNLYLIPHQTFTAALFAMSDAGLTGDGAAILVSSDACTFPDFQSLTTRLAGNIPYQPLLDFGYIDANTDTGPTDISRTREGNFEVIEMGEVAGATLAAIDPGNGAAANCSAVQKTAALIPAADITTPGGGLSGSAAVIDVAVGTMFAFSADAIDGFRDQPLLTDAGVIHPNLSDAVTDSTAGTVTAYVPIDGRIAVLTYPMAQAIDAVSALLTANRIVTDWDFTPGSGAQTDWVISMPTKHFYVDAYGPEAASSADYPIAPFPNAFGTTDGRAPVYYALSLYDRSGNRFDESIGFPELPPPPLELPASYETQVISIVPRSSQDNPTSMVLGSRLISVLPVYSNDSNSNAAGQLVFDFAQPENAQQSRPSQEFNVMFGLPVTGFEAINYINANVTPGVLANYSGVYPVHTTAACGTTSTSPNPSTPCTTQ